ncbi:cobalt transporter [Haloprofundus marisrubri]|uniref:Cobalt transporter n=1 Tax=Haloprofundus marisrubri TaxID=1514971 RepID=A0A0W1R4U9_9EURY|nr:hemolysin family protein [Haloprofundus marisrubri]KTG08465.1 cobalt transporter [Haloprofundus marisrubri]
MVDVVLSLGRVLLALFLVVLNGFFVAAEFAFVKIRSTQVDALVERGGRSATIVQEATDNLDDYLAVSQLGITIASLGLGWIGEPAVAALLDPVLEPILPAGTLHLVTFGVGFGIITFLHVVFGELAPKTLGIQEAERIALLVAAPMKLFYYLFVPGIIVFNGTANFFTRLAGVSPASEHDETHSEEEILTIVTQSGRHGDVEMDEVEMIEAVFDLGDTVAREIMTPRPDVLTLRAGTPLNELRSTVANERYTRYPVVEDDDPGQVVGFVHVKDVFRAVEGGAAEVDRLRARDIARDVVVVPEDRDIDDILAEFRTRKVQMAVVIDEWGSFEGIVTIEDVIEELVGDIRDEFDPKAPEAAIEPNGDGDGYALDGRVTIDEVNETLGTHFESDEFDTIGGLVLSELGRAPKHGDQVVVDGYTLTVESVDGTRITDIVARKRGEGDDGDDSDTTANGETMTRGDDDNAASDDPDSRDAGDERGGR